MSSFSFSQCCWLKLKIFGYYVMAIVNIHWRFGRSYCFYVQKSVHRVICGNNCPTRCKNIQFIYICKLLYMFRMVSPPIIRSSYHCTYSIWHYWDRYCYLSWTWLDGNCSHLVTFATDGSNGLINARYCRYSDMSSWWWEEIPSETCTAVYRYK